MEGEQSFVWVVPLKTEVGEFNPISSQMLISMYELRAKLWAKSVHVSVRATPKKCDWGNPPACMCSGFVFFGYTPMQNDTALATPHFRAR